SRDCSRRVDFRAFLPGMTRKVMLFFLFTTHFLYYLVTLRNACFLSSKMTDIIAQRESLGERFVFIASLKVTNIPVRVVARLQRAGGFVLTRPAILAGLMMLIAVGDQDKNSTSA